MDLPCRYGDMRVRPLALDDYEEDPYGFEKKWSLYDADAQAEIDKYVFHSFALLHYFRYTSAAILSFCKPRSLGPSILTRFM